MMNPKSLLYRLYYYRAFGYKYIDESTLNIDIFDEFKNINSIKKELKVCNLCPLCKSRTKTVLPQGNEGAKIMFILESPTIGEDLGGRVYSGNLGEKLQNLIKEHVGLDEEMLYTSLLIKCKVSQNAKFDREIMLKCVPYLMDEIKLVNPKIIFTFGEICSKALLKNENLPDMLMIHGSIFKDGTSYIVPTFDIKHVITNPSKMELLISDLKKVKELL